MRRRGARFSSRRKIKGLLAATPTPEPDEAIVAGFLLSGADTGPQTFFEGIRRLPAAHLLEVALDDPVRAEPQRYWELPCEEERAGEDAADRFGELFRDSVRIHTRSDVPVGTCLSGGLDSSSIVCTASTLKSDGLLPPSYRHRAFGYVPPDESVSERPWMDMVVDRTGVVLDEVRPTAERFEASLETIARQQDEPFGSTSIAAQWFVFEAARAAGMKVMLDGQGADEVLGGYHGYLATVAAGMVSDRRPLAYARLALDHRRRLGTWPLPATTVTGLLPASALTVAARVRGRDSHEPPSITPALGGALAEPLLTQGADGRAAADGPPSLASPPSTDEPPVAASLRRPQLDGTLDRGARTVSRPPLGRARVPAPGRGEGTRSRHEAAPSRGDEGRPSGADPDAPRQARLPRRPESGGAIRARVPRRAGSERHKRRGALVQPRRRAGVHRRRADRRELGVRTLADRQRQALGAGHWPASEGP